MILEKESSNFTFKDFKFVHNSLFFANVLCKFFYKISFFQGMTKFLCFIPCFSIQVGIYLLWRRSSIFILNLEHISHLVSIVNLDQVNADWVTTTSNNSRLGNGFSEPQVFGFSESHKPQVNSF